MKLGSALRELHRSERRLAHTLFSATARHRTEHEFFHIGRDVVRWSQDHLRQIAEAGTRHGLDLEPAPHVHARTGPTQRRLATWLGRRPEPALMLLADLRRLHLLASGVAVDWQILAQGAQAARDESLVELAGRCRPQTLRQAKWASALITVLSPQIITS